MKIGNIEFYRSGMHLILTGISCIISVSIGVLAHFWVFGAIFGMLLLAICLWHYLTWNKFVTLFVRKGGMRPEVAYRKAWKIRSTYKENGVDQMLYDPTMSGMPCNIWHKKDPYP